MCMSLIYIRFKCMFVINDSIVWVQYMKLKWRSTLNCLSYKFCWPHSVIAALWNVPFCDSSCLFKLMPHSLHDFFTIYICSVIFMVWTCFFSPQEKHFDILVCCLLTCLSLFRSPGRSPLKKLFLWFNLFKSVANQEHSDTLPWQKSLSGAASVLLK